MIQIDYYGVEWIMSLNTNYETWIDALKMHPKEMNQWDMGAWWNHGHNMHDTNPWPNWINMQNGMMQYDQMVYTYGSLFRIGRYE